MDYRKNTKNSHLISVTYSIPHQIHLKVFFKKKKNGLTKERIYHFISRFFFKEFRQLNLRCFYLLNRQFDICIDLSSFWIRNYPFCTYLLLYQRYLQIFGDDFLEKVRSSLRTAFIFYENIVFSWLFEYEFCKRNLSKDYRKV